MLRNTTSLVLVFEGVVALCVACALHAALAHEFTEFMTYLSSAILMGGTMTITRMFRPEVFESDES